MPLALLICALLTGVGLVISVFAARLLVHWSAPRLIDVLAIDDERVILPAVPATLHPGTFALHSANGHALLGPVLAHDRATVTRAILRTIGDIGTARRAKFDGGIHAHPSEIGAFHDVQIDTPLGPAPAWRMDPPAPPDLWIIHVHGLDAARLNALRTVDALRDQPAVHLVVSYRGDGDAPPTPGRTTRLGLDEWADVDAALDHAAAHGGTRVLLVGWSMGASIALLAGERSAHRDLVVGYLLVSPVTDWRATMVAGAQNRRLPFPRMLAVGVEAILSSEIGCRLAGIREPLDFDELDWTRRPRVTKPTLVVHSPGDLTTPLAATRRFAAVNAPHVEVVETVSAPHSREFNVDPETVHASIDAWATRVLSSDA